jgi:hypothetical protein
MLYILVIVVAYPLALAGLSVYATKAVNGDIGRIRERWGDEMAAQYAQTMQQTMPVTLIKPGPLWGTVLAVAGCADVWAFT